LPEYLRPDTDLATVVDALLAAKAAKAAAPAPAAAQPAPAAPPPAPAPAPAAAAKPRFRKLVKEDLAAWGVDVAGDADGDDADDGRHRRSWRVDSGAVG